MSEKAHELGGRECWCNPRLAKLCLECEGATGSPCWLCGGSGLVAAEVGDPEDLIVTHIYEREGT